MIKFGDIFSIEVSGGRAYFQFIKKNKFMGSLIRVFPGIFEESLDFFDELVELETNFWVFLPVKELLSQGKIKKEATSYVPLHSRTMPIFRTGAMDPETKRVEVWWLWDGERSWKIGNLSRDQRYLPIRGNWNDIMLKSA